MDKPHAVPRSFLQPCAKASSALKAAFAAPKMEVKVLGLGALAAFAVWQLSWVRPLSNVRILNARLGPLADSLCPLLIVASGAYGIKTFVSIIRSPEKPQTEKETKEAGKDEKRSFNLKTARVLSAKVRQRLWSDLPLESRLLLGIAPLGLILWQTGLAARFNQLTIQGKSMGEMVEAICIAQIGGMLTWGGCASLKAALVGREKRGKEKAAPEKSRSRLVQGLQRLEKSCNRCYSEKFEFYILVTATLAGVATWAAGGLHRLEGLMAGKQSVQELFSALCAVELGGIALWGLGRVIKGKRRKQKQPVTEKKAPLTPEQEEEEAYANPFYYGTTEQAGAPVP